MPEIVKEMEEVAAAEADVHSAIARLVAIVVDRHYYIAGMAAAAAENIGRGFVGTVLPALERAEDCFHRTRLINILDVIGMHDPSVVIEVLDRVAEEVPDEDVQDYAGVVSADLGAPGRDGAGHDRPISLMIADRDHAGRTGRSGIESHKATCRSRAAYFEKDKTVR